MCDLLLLLFAVGLVTAFLSMKEVASGKKREQEGERTVTDLKDRLAEEEKKVGIWTTSAAHNQALIKRYEDLFVGTGLTPDEVRGKLDSVAKVMVDAEEAIAAADDRAKVAEVDRVRATTDAESAAKQATDAQAAATKAVEAATKAVEAADAANTLANQAREEKATADATAQRERKRAEDAVARAKQAEGMLGTQQGENSGLTDEIKKLNDVVAGAAGINKEILGIPGEMGNVVFVVDRSQSMKDGDRWEDARRTVTSWIKHLPVKKSALVLFDSDVKVVPAALDNGRTTEFNTQELLELNEENRAQMSSELEAMSPQGATQTLKGLRRAMQFKDLDAIILFTDGAPDSSGVVADASDPREAIYNLVDQWKKSHPEGRVHTVGIGDYFNRRMGEFLVKVAQHGDGTFIGR